MIDFDTAFDRLIGHEGAYVNDPRDPGGETNWGVSKRCLHAATRVLTADLEWVPCGGLQTGDRLLAFDEMPERHGKLNLRRLRLAKVLDVGQVTLPAFRIRTEKREVVASGDHQWLTRRGTHRTYSWRSTQDLLVPPKGFGRDSTEVRIAHFMDPWPRLADRDAGYLAGVLDGEGHVGSVSNIGFSQKENACLIAATDAAHRLGFRLKKHNFRHEVWTNTFENVEGRPFFAVEVAGKLGAHRLLANLSKKLQGVNIASTLTAPEKVVAVEPLGELGLIGLETSTKTLIAEGLLSHNSYPHLDIKSLTREQAKEIYRSDFWDKVGDAVHPSIKFQIFDFAVNSGVKRAIKELQRAVRVVDDGNWGPKSDAAARAMDHNDILMRLLGLRLKFMAKLPNWDHVSEGWANRIGDNLLFAAEDN